MSFGSFRTAGQTFFRPKPTVVPRAVTSPPVAYSRRLRVAQGRAVLKRPRDEKCLAVAIEPEGQPALAGDHAKTVGRVEGVDAVECGEFQARAAGVGKDCRGPAPMMA